MKNSTTFRENIDSSDSEEELRQEPQTYITLLNGKGKMKARKTAAVLRTRYFSQISNKEDYYYGLLVCHIPFREERELMDGYNSAYDAFYAKRNQLKPITNMSVEEFSTFEREIHGSVRRIVAEQVVENVITDIENIPNDQNVNIDHNIISSIQSQHHVVENDLSEIEKDRMTNEQYTNAVSSLNCQQKKLFTTVAKAIANDKSPQVRTFVTGGAGSGKTYTLKLIVEHIFRLALPAAVVIGAPMGE